MKVRLVGQVRRSQIPVTRPYRPIKRQETGEREGGIINLNIKLECASSAIA